MSELFIPMSANFWELFLAPIGSLQDHEEDLLPRAWMIMAPSDEGKALKKRIGMLNESENSWILKKSKRAAPFSVSCGFTNTFRA